MSNDLIDAIKQENAERVHELVSADPGIIRIPGSLSPILLSIYMGQREITDILMDAAEHLNLHEAAASGDAARVEEIVQEQPGRVDEHGSDGFTPLGLAAYFGHVDAVEVLLRYGADIDLPSSNTQRVAPLQSAISAKHTPVIDLLLAHGADVNVAQERDITPLMQAAHQGNTVLVQRLLQLGANPKARTTDGYDALWYARDVGAEDVIAILQ